MKRRWLLIGSVVAVTAVIDLVIIPWVWPSGGSDWIHAMAPCHGSLLAAWIALGGRGTPWRLVAAVLGVATWIWTSNWFFDSAPYPMRGTFVEFWTTILAAEMFVLSGLLMLARLLGLELTDTLRGDTTQAVADDTQWIQFSLRTLMSWTTAVAVLLATLRYFPRPLLENLLEEQLIFAAILLGSAFTALGALWIALGVRWPTVRIIVLVVTLIVGVAIFQLAAGSRKDLEGIVTFFVAQAAYLVGSLWLVRLAGYRLVWRRRVWL